MGQFFVFGQPSNELQDKGDVLDGGRPDSHGRQDSLQKPGISRAWKQRHAAKVACKIEGGVVEEAGIQSRSQGRVPWPGASARAKGRGSIPTASHGRAVRQRWPRGPRQPRRARRTRQPWRSGWRAWIAWRSRRARRPREPGWTRGTCGAVGIRRTLRAFRSSQGRRTLPRGTAQSRAQRAARRI
jgi:hypothetical protein